MHTIIWTYTVKPEHATAFERVYSSDGDWAQFFGKDAHYTGTTLHKSRDADYHYVTLDTWTSAQAYEAFRAAHQAKYDALDQRFSAFTVSEKFVGAFDLLA